MLCCSITVGLNHETTHLRDSGPLANTSFVACMPSYVRVGRGWDTIMKCANELRS